jgi:4-hydroxy-tetrahydrodipicolinate reductase
MDIALVGTGQMGSAVERLAAERGHRVVARFDVDRPFTDARDVDELAGADVLIDFTLPSIAPANIERCCRWNLTAVIGTTGWYGELDRVRGWIRDSDAAILYAPNFSIGVSLLVRALKALTPLLDRLPEYDPFIHEIHHVRKVDSPSGTALLLADVLLQGLARKTRVEVETQHARIGAEALHVTSTRAGHVFGHHVVGLDSPFDRIEFVHDAKGREGFAFGALKSAEWLKGRRGLFTLDDVLESWLEPAPTS